MKRILKPVVAIAAALIFILFPIKPADLVLRMSIEGTNAGLCRLYYSTTESDYFDEEKSITPRNTNTVDLYDFRIPASEASNLHMLRLDFPNYSNYGVASISVYSGGVARKMYDPGIFFAPGNVSAYKDLSYGVNASSDAMYIYPSGEDPQFVFSEDFARSVKNLQCRFYLTRILIVSFIVATWYISQNKKARIGD